MLTLLTSGYLHIQFRCWTAASTALVVGVMLGEPASAAATVNAAAATAHAVDALLAHQPVPWED